MLLQKLRSLYKILNQNNKLGLVNKAKLKKNSQSFKNNKMNRKIFKKCILLKWMMRYKVKIFDKIF